MQKSGFHTLAVRRSLWSSPVPLSVLAFVASTCWESSMRLCPERVRGEPPVLLVRSSAQTRLSRDPVQSTCNQHHRPIVCRREPQNNKVYESRSTVRVRFFVCTAGTELPIAPAVQRAHLCTLLSQRYHRIRVRNGGFTLANVESQHRCIKPHYASLKCSHELHSHV
jgi:hypothetical protein